MAFFRSDDAIRDRGRTSDDRETVALPLGEAFALGRRIFGGLLAPARPGRS